MSGKNTTVHRGFHVREEKTKHTNFYRILEISSVFVGVIMALYYFYPVFASPPTTPFAPGETTDPSCSPGDPNCTVYPPLTTTITTSTAIIMGTSSLRFAYDANNYSQLTVALDGALTVSSTNGATTTFVSKASFSSNVYFDTVASGTWNGNAIGVAYGGTNSSTIPTNGSIIYSDGSRYNATAVGISGQILQSAGSGAPVWISTSTMGFVNLQGATSGTQQVGNFNISGTGLIGTKLGVNTTSPVASFAVQGVAGTDILDIASSTGSSLLHILKTGTVGIGTTGPRDLLEISNSAVLGVAAIQFSAGNDSVVSNFSSGRIASGHTSGAYSGGYIDLQYPTNANTFTTGLRLKNGLIGIGTTTPIAKLTVQGSGTGNPFSIVSSTVSASSMFTVQTNGNIGINSSSPISSLALQGTSGIDLLEIASSTGASIFRIQTNGRIGVNSSSPISWFSIQGNDGANPFSINSSTGASMLNILTNGNVGINSSSPIANFSVQGTDGINPFSINSSTGSVFLTILTNGNVGVSTATPNARLELWGAGNTSSTITLNTFSNSGTSTFKVDDAGNASFANDGLYYEASSSVTYLNSFETGGLNFDDNAGLVTWVDLNVSSTIAGTPNAYTASISGNPMIMVYGDSNGTGGATDLTVSIGTSTTSTYKLYVDAGASSTAGLGVNGFIKASGFIAGTTTLDIAETYPVDPQCDANGNCPKVGDVVCSTEDASSSFFIEKCSVGSNDNIIGVVSGNPGFILGGYDVQDIKIKGLYPTSFRPVALAGRVPVNVSAANGSIKAGDYLAASDVPGIAVKATEPGRIIGMALQSFDGSASTTGTIKIFVNSSWWLGSAAALTDDQVSSFPDFGAIVLDQFTLAVKNSLRKLGLLIKDGVATVKQLFADKVQTNELCVGQTCIDEQQLQNLLEKTSTQAVGSGGSGTNSKNSDIIESPTEPPASDSAGASTTTDTSTSSSTAETATSTVDGTISSTTTPDAAISAVTTTISDTATTTAL